MTMTSEPANQRGALLSRLGFLLALLLIVLPVFSSAVDRFFAGDQIRYFHELGNDFRLTSTLRLIDYNAARKYAKGDELLYRPLTGLLLAVETSAFGYHYRAWNVVQLGLHLSVCFLLFEFLLNLGPAKWAGVVALLFSVLTANLELVVWNHLSGYLLGDALFLMSLIGVQRLTGLDQQNRRRWLILYVLSAFGAACCHEIGVVGAAGTSAYLLWQNRRKRLGFSKIEIAVLLSPLMLYALLYAGHVARSERWLWTNTSARSSIALEILRCLRLWTQRTLDPWSSTCFLNPYDRFAWSRYSLVGGVWRALLLAMPGGVFLFCLRRGLTRERLRETGGLAAVLGAILVGFVLMVNVGREHAARITYYCYFFSLVSSLLFFVPLDFARIGRAPGTIALLLLLGLASAQAVRTGGEARRLSALEAPAIAYFDRLECFVREHRGEPGFAFAAGPSAKLDPLWDHWDGYPDHPPDRRKTVSELLYPAYYDASILLTGPDPAHSRYLVDPAAWAPAERTRSRSSGAR